LDFTEIKCEDVTELNWLSSVQLQTQQRIRGSHKSG